MVRLEKRHSVNAQHEIQFAFHRILRSVIIINVHKYDDIFDKVLSIFNSNYA